MNENQKSALKKIENLKAAFDAAAVHPATEPISGSMYKVFSILADKAISNVYKGRMEMAAKWINTIHSLSIDDRERADLAATAQLLMRQ